MHRRSAPSFLIVSALVVAAFAPASAQLVNGRWQAPAKSGGSAAPRGTTPAPTARPTPAQPQSAVSPVPIRVMHAVLMSDGSIFADFGSGLEQVRRACPSSVHGVPLQIIGGAPSVAATRPASMLQPVPGIQPAPKLQPAPAHLSTQQAQARPLNMSSPAQTSCHLRDAGGRAFVTR